VGSSHTVLSVLIRKARPFDQSDGTRLTTMLGHAGEFVNDHRFVKRVYSSDSCAVAQMWYCIIRRSSFDLL
jgi:hypothetical protein